MDQRICVFGDSVTYAGYIKTNWCTLLRNFLEETLEENVELFNLGINGQTGPQIAQRFNAEALVRQPTKVIFAYGVNDSAYLISDNQPLVTEEEFKSTTQELITLAKVFTEKIIFIGPALGDDSLLKPYSESKRGKAYSRARTEKYNALLAGVVVKNQCQFVESFPILNYKDFSDGLHPNENGHKKIFDLVKEAI